jgi:hypothetical protein
LYDSSDKQLVDELIKAKKLCNQYNNLCIEDIEKGNEIIKKLFSKTGNEFMIMPNFYCDYGFNIEIGEKFYSNHNLDVFGHRELFKRLFGVDEIERTNPSGIIGTIIESERIEDKCQEEKGDSELLSFSNFYEPTYDIDKQVPCYLTYTNKETHKIILDNLDKCALYSGLIVGIGPRYCPSIEEK